MKTNQQKVFDEVKAERERQDKKFGIANSRNHAPYEWLMILSEEVGEANQAALEVHFGNKHASLNEYRKELIQVAAVAIAAIEDLDAQNS